MGVRLNHPSVSTCGLPIAYGDWQTSKSWVGLIYRECCCRRHDVMIKVLVCSLVGSYNTSLGYLVLQGTSSVGLIYTFLLLKTPFFKLNIYILKSFLFTSIFPSFLGSVVLLFGISPQHTSSSCALLGWYPRTYDSPPSLKAYEVYVAFFFFFIFSLLSSFVIHPSVTSLLLPIHLIFPVNYFYVNTQIHVLSS